MSTQSTTDPKLFLLDSHGDFQEFALKVAAQARRYIFILSRDLDEGVYGTPEFVDIISKLARDNRYTEIKVLVKNTRELAESSHALIKLAQRLPSKITVRKITVEPDNTDMGFMICDTDFLLYKNDEEAHQGFASFNAGVEVKRLREVFDYVWGYAEADADLQVLNI